jgi:hypothetical protein
MWPSEGKGVAKKRKKILFFLWSQAMRAMGKNINGKINNNQK